MAPIESRPYDALYDATYTVSGARDHYKQQGRSAGFMVEKVPEYGNMFSEMVHFPSQTLRLKNEDRIPAFVDREFRPPVSDQMQRAFVSTSAAVSGSNNPLYYTRPLIAPGASTLTVRLAPPRAPTPPPPPVIEPPTKDAATQSDYRESETQTIPWSPEYVVPKRGEVSAKQAALQERYHCLGPEVLEIADLKYGAGLPGGAAQVALVEKRRARRAFEAGLPPLEDLERLPARLAAVEAEEGREWAEREGVLAAQGEERLGRLAETLQEREATIEAAHRERVEARATATLASKMPVFGAIAANRVKALRTLAASRRKVDDLHKATRKTLVQQYADYGSPVYAPVQREGRGGTSSPTSRIHASSTLQLDPEAFLPTTLPGVLNLQASLPPKLLTAKVATPAPPLTMTLTAGSTQQGAGGSTLLGKSGATVNVGSTQTPTTSGSIHTLLASTKKALTASSSPRKRAEVAIQADVEAIGQLLATAKATAPRGVGEVWPYPLDQECPVGSWGGAGRASRPGALVGAGAGGTAGRHTAKGPGDTSTLLPDRPTTPTAPPLPVTRALDAAAVLLQRLLRGRAAQNRLYAAKVAQLQLVRELTAEPVAAPHLGEEGLAAAAAAAGYSAAADVAVGALLCRLCVDLGSLPPQQLRELLVGAGVQVEEAAADAPEAAAEAGDAGSVGPSAAAGGQEGASTGEEAGAGVPPAAAVEGVATPAAETGIGTLAAAAAAVTAAAVVTATEEAAAGSGVTSSSSAAGGVPDAAGGTDATASASAAAAAGSGADPAAAAEGTAAAGGGGGGGDALAEAWGSAGQLSGGNSSNSLGQIGSRPTSAPVVAAAGEGAAAAAEGGEVAATAAADGAGTAAAAAAEGEEVAAATAADGAGTATPAAEGEEVAAAAAADGAAAAAPIEGGISPEADKEGTAPASMVPAATAEAAAAAVEEVGSQPVTDAPEGQVEAAAAVADSPAIDEAVGAGSGEGQTSSQHDSSSSSSSSSSNSSGSGDGASEAVMAEGPPASGGREEVVQQQQEEGEKGEEVVTADSGLPQGEQGSQEQQ